jgi:hypothetical protein
MPRTTKEQRERARLCRFPGCKRAWFTTFSPIGPCCLQHLPEAPAPLPTVPTTPASKHWNDDKD